MANLIRDQPHMYKESISKNQHFLFHLIQSYYILFLLFWG